MQDYPLLPSVARHGMTFEVGPAPWGCVVGALYEQSLKLIGHALDYLHAHNAALESGDGAGQHPPCTLLHPLCTSPSALHPLSIRFASSLPRRAAPRLTLRLCRPTPLLQAGRPPWRPHTVTASITYGYSLHHIRLQPPSHTVTASKAAMPLRNNEPHNEGLAHDAHGFCFSS